MLACVGLATHPAPMARRLFRRRRAALRGARLRHAEPPRAADVAARAPRDAALPLRFPRYCQRDCARRRRPRRPRPPRGRSGSEARAGRSGRRRRHGGGDRGGAVGVSRRADCGAAATEGGGGRAVLGRRRGVDRWAGLRLRPRSGRRIRRSAWRPVSRSPPSWRHSLPAHAPGWPPQTSSRRRRRSRWSSRTPACSACSASSTSCPRTPRWHLGSRTRAATTAWGRAS